MASEEPAVFFNVILYEMLIGDVHNEKRKILIIIGTTILFCVCAVLFAVISKSRSGYKTNDDLLKGLTKAVNSCKELISEYQFQI